MRIAIFQALIKMTDVIITLKIMPEDLEVNLEELANEVIKKIESFGGKIKSKEFQPVAFGLNAIILKFFIDEAKGWAEEQEEQLSSITGVNSVNVEEVRRAVG